MKKLIISCSFVLLSGCSMLQDLWVANYDTNEYLLVNKIRTIAQLKKCDEFSVNMLYSSTLELKNFSQYLPRNRQSIELNNDLFKIVDELHNKPQPIGNVYCQAKLNIIEHSAERIQQVTGSKPR
jgi:hypothetical protein